MREETVAGPHGRAVSETLRAFLIRVLPPGFRKWVRTQQRRFGIHWPPTGRVEFGQLRRPTPISRVFGLDRGLHISRYYIERFLDQNAAAIQGRVLEFGDPYYTLKFGGPRVTHSDVVNVAPGDPCTTIVADLARGEAIPTGTFDCIICTQTLQMIYDVRAALGNLARILKPGGVLLITTHGISQIGRFEGVDRWGEYWRFTSQSLKKLVPEFFSPEEVTVTAYGNVLAAVAHLHGLAVGDVTPEELDDHDPAYEVIIGVRAVKLK
ncbi:MAG: methyltransferase domain-containing protein [Bryobacteraceae bacterium]